MLNNNITMKSKHTREKLGDDEMIYCELTGGYFSTVIWKVEKTKNNICPCCKREVKLK
jgi:hypothetical protein